MEELDKKLQTLHNTKDWKSAVDVVSSVCGLFGLEMAEDPFLFQHPKINAHTSWFMNATGFVNRPASYEVKHDNKNSLDIKLYWGTKISKTILSWMVGISPNFEDAKTFESEKYNIGLDIVIPKECDSVVLLVSNKYKIRSFELKEKLSRTDKEIIEKLQSLKLKSTQSVEDKRLFHNILWDAFNFEPINRKFYKELVDRFTVLRDHLVKKGFDKQDAVIFSTRLIGRILFVWFLRKKKLINEKAGYFNADDVYHQTDYYKDRLEKLFFETLNTEILERGFDDVFTPYLNGGLFEASRTDFYKDIDLTIPDGYFSQFFEILSHYNFTVDESSPEFEQVAVDPEMLGRIFESLLAEQNTETGEQARKAKGAFYTPREIVQYMCEQSLKEYLKTKIEDDTYRDIRIEEIVSMSEAVFRDQDHNKRRDWKPYVQPMTKALDELTVLDPAVGSGAYPMGMLHLLVKVYTRLDSKYEKNLSKLKRSILNRSLFGSDIDLTAIEICRLRAWLSLIVDLEENEQVAPLPNLEFHFVCANTLISLNRQGAFEDTVDLKDKMKKIREEYYNTNSKTLKETLKKRYEKLLNPSQASLLSENDNILKTYKPFSHEGRASFFDPDLMFGIKHFSIVFGNPPYISYYSKQSIKLDKKIEDNLRSNYKFLTDSSSKIRINSVMFFLERGFSLLSDKGILSYIQDLNLLENTFIPIRKYVTDNFTIIEIIKDLTAFENVGSGQIITSFKKEKPSDNLIFIKNSISEDIYQKYKQSDISKNTYEWIQNNHQDLCSRIEKNTQQLENVCEVHTGVAVNATEDGKKAFLKLNVEEGTYPIMIGSQSVNSKYCDPKTDMFLLYDKDLEKKYNDEFNKKYMEEKGSSQRPFNLRKMEEYNRPKIVLRQSDNKLTATFTEKLMFGNYSLFNIYNKENDIELLKLILGILNSKLLTWYGLKKDIILAKPGKTPQIRSGQRGPLGLRQLPIALIDSDSRKKISKEIINIVSDILDKKKNSISTDTEDMENKIDELVMDLYGLKEDEKEIIRNSIR